ncbi:tetraacyldisaccharide 4'-kinase [Lacinutrix iliipiscaria]|uniref:Tetraacyldisaccharide 4'-kinase n=1 Tax=Lacinutrix iliipiscaria TaxID=1230532 RepID=A0ABW5WP37_9FLAO
MFNFKDKIITFVAVKLLRKIFFLIVPIYYLVTWLRNVFYDLGVFKSKAYDFPVICVGNLSVGGTGKTPMIEYLIRLLKDENQVATLSRGYKRSTEGFYLANEAANAKTLGDEPFQFYKKFKNEIQVAVDSDRQNGIATLSLQERIPDVILLDDAFQHRKVQAGLNILLTTYNNLYVNDWVLPTGNLREPKSGAKRAQIIVVTKCPKDLKASDKERVVKRIQPQSNQKVFFSSIVYAKEVFSEAKKMELKALKDFTLVTGIANAEPLVHHLESNGLKFEHLNFKDHHSFTAQDIELFESKSLIITTEKDYVRLYNYESLKDKLFYLPIEVVIDKSDDFNALIKVFVTP